MLEQRTFTVTDFMTMVEAGLFTDQKVELLDGVIYTVSPANPNHEDVIDELHERFVQAFADRARVRSQNVLDIRDPLWLPHPDLMLLKRRSYRQTQPQPDDVLLLIEASNTSLAAATGGRLETYAAAGIREYWVADLKTSEWLVHRDPVADRYRSVTRVDFSEPIAPLSFPEDAAVWL